MRTIFKYILARTYKPLLVQYLSKPRLYRSHGISLMIGPTVFHPGFFHTTHFLLNYLKTKRVAGKKVLELGAGSGLISIYAAKQNAIVTASDISLAAIHYLMRNSRYNHVKMEVLHADLFEKMGPAIFDLVLVNPPFYKKDPDNMQEHAWYCGKEGNYFKKFFSGLAKHIHEDSEVIMVLCETCDLQMIIALAQEQGFEMKCIRISQTIIEKNFLYQIKFLQ